MAWEWGRDGAGDIRWAALGQDRDGAYGTTRRADSLADGQRAQEPVSAAAQAQRIAAAQEQETAVAQEQEAAQAQRIAVAQELRTTATQAEGIAAAQEPRTAAAQEEQVSAGTTDWGPESSEPLTSGAVQSLGH